MPALVCQHTPPPWPLGPSLVVDHVARVPVRSSALRQVAKLLEGVLGEQSIQAMSNAAALLWRLVLENPRNQTAIASAGSTSDLIALLKSGTDGAKSYAAERPPNAVQRSQQRSRWQRRSRRSAPPIPPDDVHLPTISAGDCAGTPFGRSIYQSGPTTRPP